MIELILLNYLKSELDYPIYLEEPTRDDNGNPKNCIVFEKTGSVEKNKLKSATFAFKSYGESMYKAAMLNEELKSVLEDGIKLDDIAKIKLNSDYNFTDTETKRYRYQAVFDIKYY